MIQQGVSVGGITPTGPQDSEGGMTIGKVMDWTEARLEEIRAREEEEDEEEEKEKERERGRPNTTAPAPKLDVKAKAPAGNTPQTRPKEQVRSFFSVMTSQIQCLSPCDSQAPSLPTPNSPRHQTSTHLPSEPSSPSPPPPQPIAVLRSNQRPIKPRPGTKTEAPQLLSNAHTPAFDFRSEPSTILSPFSESSIPIAAGAKRRHAMMMMMDSISPTVPISGSSAPHPPVAAGTNGGGYGASGGHGTSNSGSRRRTRSSRNLVHQMPQNQNIGLVQSASEAMEVEEEGGRERKRVSRR